MVRIAGSIFISVFVIVSIALAWVIPYAAITSLRSGHTDRAKKWELLVRVSTENPKWDFANTPPISMRHGFLLAYSHAWAYGQDPRYRQRILENAGLAFGVLVLLGGGIAILFLANRPSTLHGDARFGTIRDARNARLLGKEA